jgi:hypothetical protein
MSGITVDKSTREVVQPPPPPPEETVVIEMSEEDARKVFNFLEYATRTDADWRGYTDRTISEHGVALTAAGGREQAEALAKALGETTGQGWSGSQHKAGS